MFKFFQLHIRKMGRRESDCHYRIRSVMWRRGRVGMRVRVMMWMMVRSMMRTMGVVVWAMGVMVRSVWWVGSRMVVHPSAVRYTRNPQNISSLNIEVTDAGTCINECTRIHTLHSKQ